MAELRDGVPLTELGVITRWSLAVRQSEAERADLIAELRADLAWLEKNAPRQATPPPAPVEEPAAIDDDAPAAKPSTPLRRLAPVAATRAAPTKSAPTKSAPTTPAATKSAATKSAPTKPAARKAAPTRAKASAKADAPAQAAAPRGRRPAAGE